MNHIKEKENTMKENEETESEEPITLLCLTTTHSLLHHHIPTVNHFKTKWSIAGAKLTHLQTHLTHFSSDHPNSSTSNSLSLHLLHSISQTLTDAVSLSHHCQSPSPDLPLGKLLTQSHLDSLIATLHRHLTDCNVLLRSGLLIETPTLSTTETVRSLSRNLIARLQIGSTESRCSALDSLLTLLHEDDKNVTIAVSQGVVPVLVRLLDSLYMKEKTVAAIARVSNVDCGKSNLLAEGLLLLNHLVRVLDSGSGFAIEKACIALQALSFSRDNARAIGCGGGISSLLGICRGGTPGAQASAAAVLRNLAKFDEIRENFAEENAVVVLLGLCSSGTALAQENIIGCVANLISEDESMRVLAFREGGVECLKNFWNSAPMIRSLEVAVEMVRYLAMTGPIDEVLVAEGFVGRVMGVLNCDVLAVRIAAARAVYAMGLNGGSKTKKEMGECGCVPLLIKMLDGKGVEEKESAAMALSVLLQHPFNRRVFRKDERGILSAVHLLNPNLVNLDKKYPVSLLVSLLNSKTCRKQMVSAGACVYTQKLVELDVLGSKKLFDGLGRGKIWGIFARP